MGFTAGSGSGAERLDPAWSVVANHANAPGVHPSADLLKRASQDSDFENFDTFEGCHQIDISLGFCCFDTGANSLRLQRLHLSLADFFADLSIRSTDRHGKRNDATEVVTINTCANGVSCTGAGTTAAKSSDGEGGGGAVDTRSKPVEGAGVDLGIILIVDRGACSVGC